MKTIKKTTLIAAITAMAAIAMPSMASAAVWGPLNTNQSLDTTSVSYNAVALGISWSCAGQHLSTHVRTPASSTLDVTAASWTSCQGSGSSANCWVSMTPTGLPWTATASSTTAVASTVHAQVTFNGSCLMGGLTFNVDGTPNGAWSASTHTLSILGGAVALSAGGSPLGAGTVTGNWRNPTQTLTLT